MPDNVVYNVDCMDYMKTVPDRFFDLAIVDPPYGIKVSEKMGKSHKRGKLGKYKKVTWDNEPPPPITSGNSSGYPGIKSYGEATILTYRPQGALSFGANR